MPAAAIAQEILGLGQIVGGYIQERNAEKELKQLHSPKYARSQGILDFYSKALSRYNVSPTQSAMYKRQNNTIQRNTAAGLSTLAGNGSGQGGISSLIQGANDAALAAEVAAEREQSQRFGVLGQAASMKAGEDRMAFQINQMDPYERNYNRLSQKAGGGAQIINAGISNAFGGLRNYSDMKMLDKIYADGVAKPVPGSTTARRPGSGIGDSTEAKYGGATLDYLIRNRKILRGRY